MTDAEDQVRRYAAAVTRAQRPVEVGEVTTRSRRSVRRPLVVAAALALVVGIIATAVLVRDGHGSPTRVEVVPTTSSEVTPASNCPAASLTVTGTSGERLHAGWLPAGFALRGGNENDLTSISDFTYSTPRGRGDRPRVEILRRRTTTPLADLYSGTPRPITVQGHPGILSVGEPHVLPFTAVLWNPVPGVAIVVNGLSLTEADLRRVAENVEYQPGGTFTYPARPEVTVTRAQAFATARHETSDADAALTSFGEIDAVSALVANRRPTLASGVEVTRPVWVVWTPGRGGGSVNLSGIVPATIVDATTGTVIVASTPVLSRALESLTDRSAPTCAPPFGLLTRSEVAYLRPTRSGTDAVIKFTTEATLMSVPALDGFFQCSPDSCDPTAPVWFFVQSATDQRFTDMERGPLGARPDTKPGSWSITTLDARTGPEQTNLGGFSLGAGPAPAGALAVTDLAPG